MKYEDQDCLNVVTFNSSLSYNKKYFVKNCLEDPPKCKFKI